MKPYLCLICIFAFMFGSCDSNRRNLHSFKKVNIDNVPKLIKINVSNNSSDEGSDYWNNYYISVIDAKTGALDKKIKFTADARNDKGKVMEINENAVVLLTDEFTLIDLKTSKVSKGKEFEKIIEQNNEKIKGRIGNVNSFSQDFISVTSKQGDTYVLSLKSFKLYPANPAKYWEIPDSLKFFHMEHLNFNTASGAPQGSVYVGDNDKGYTLEKDNANPVKSYIFEYDIQKYKPKSSKESEYVTITILDTVSFSYRALAETKKQLSDKPYISAYVNNLVGTDLYILHHNEVSDNPKKMISCYDLLSRKEKFSMELPIHTDKRIDLYGSLIWSADQKTFFWCKLGTMQPIYEYNASDGQLRMKYEK
jgi:hypothetical protein